MTNREWLNTLTDEDFARQMSYVGEFDITCIVDWLKAEHQE